MLILLFPLLGSCHCSGFVPYTNSCVTTSCATPHLKPALDTISGSCAQYVSTSSSSHSTSTTRSSSSSSSSTSSTSSSDTGYNGYTSHTSSIEATSQNPIRVPTVSPPLPTCPPYSNGTRTNRTYGECSTLYPPLFTGNAAVGRYGHAALVAALAVAFFLL